MCHALDGFLESVEEDVGVLQLVHYVGSAAVGEQRGVGGQHALVRLEVDQVVVVEGEDAAVAHAPWVRTLHLAREAAGSGACREEDEPVQHASAGNSTWGACARTVVSQGDDVRLPFHSFDVHSFKKKKSVYTEGFSVKITSYRRDFFFISTAIQTRS